MIFFAKYLSVYLIAEEGSIKECRFTLEWREFPVAER
jgi:hypothetical protein